MGVVDVHGVNGMVGISEVNFSIAEMKLFEWTGHPRGEV